MLYPLCSYKTPMRQLVLVLSIFVLSLLGLVALFNTITNTSKQSNIALAANLPDYPAAEQRLSNTLKWRSSNDSIGQENMAAFYALIKKQYPLLFDNPNIEWQEFGPSNWVAKWVGRKADLAPIVWMASPQVAVPTAAQQAKWSVPPFTSSLTTQYIYGQGSQGSKTAMIAMLEVLHDLVQKERLPDRTIYLAFPFPAQAGEAQILKALAQAGTPAEYILQTGGLIAQDMLWDLSTPVALLGVGQLGKAQITLARKSPTMDWKKLVERLREALPCADLKQEAAQQLLHQLSPELPFKQRFVFSNSWLLNWGQQHYFYPRSLSQDLVGVSTRLLPALPDTDTALLQITAPNLAATTLTTIQNILAADSVYVLGNWKWHQGFSTAKIESRSYRLLGNTCKEIFPNIITAPIWVAREDFVANSTVEAPVFYFQPIVQDPSTWQKAQWGVTERISRQNYQRMLQFYHRLLTNSI